MTKLRSAFRPRIFFYAGYWRVRESLQEPRDLSEWYCRRNANINAMRFVAYKNIKIFNK